MVEQPQIYHSREPRFIAQLGPEGWEIVDEIDNIADTFDGKPEKLAGMMRRMEDWYKAFCIWNNSNGQSPFRNT